MKQYEMGSDTIGFFGVGGRFGLPFSPACAGRGMRQIKSAPVIGAEAGRLWHYFLVPFFFFSSAARMANSKAVGSCALGGFVVPMAFFNAFSAASSVGK